MADDSESPEVPATPQYKAGITEEAYLQLERALARTGKTHAQYVREAVVAKLRQDLPEEFQGADRHDLHVVPQRAPEEDPRLIAEIVAMVLQALRASRK